MSDNPTAAGEAAAAEAAAAVAKLHLDEVTGEMISKTELKKRQKQREKEAAKKEKAAANPKTQGSSNKNAEAAEKELTPNQVRATTYSSNQSVGPSPPALRPRPGKKKTWPDTLRRT